MRRDLPRLFIRFNWISSKLMRGKNKKKKIWEIKSWSKSLEPSAFSYSAIVLSFFLFPWSDKIGPNNGTMTQNVKIKIDMIAQSNKLILNFLHFSRHSHILRLQQIWNPLIWGRCRELLVSFREIYENCSD